ncbi:cell wall integrity and stress response component 2-like [Nylanderia fulva]|uniref:cell wall integrity and stress response component 2-like n=1 Tax=Nylanderia fulva TaxID=613905 RepID=UPI0010FB3A46|nr:cell wall integrity and stress response component 2-like [Nylanderia fulva]XP_029158471.1 cell wall integrity and stress response component 2-like [Nylanderia fulva]XP_029160287.1 cell wall integrity and stress response component 2-like [Nylanderia fulva]XP_029160324.1 cell wall integrity and stress response component 2-like [Nylanderia fulva]XP_029162896.1 cell wall integrity and stress response component 2-like [Nylanderia fulva]
MLRAEIYNLQKQLSDVITNSSIVPQTSSTATSSAPQTTSTSTLVAPQTISTATSSASQTISTSTLAAPQTTSTSTSAAPQTASASTLKGPSSTIEIKIKNKLNGHGREEAVACVAMERVVVERVAVNMATYTSVIIN